MLVVVYQICLIFGVLEGLPEHRNALEELRRVAPQLEAAQAAQGDAWRIAELEDTVYALYTELSVAAEGLFYLYCSTGHLTSLPSDTFPACRRAQRTVVGVPLTLLPMHLTLLY